MRRNVVAVELEAGRWIRLECGHPLGAGRADDHRVDCPRCDRSARVARATARPGAAATTARPGAAAP